MDNIEIELKFKVEKPEVFEEFLNKEAEYVGEKHIVDTYYTPAHENYAALYPPAKWFRVRNFNGNTKLTYKFHHHDNAGKQTYTDEFETNVESGEVITEILQLLDMKELTIIDKLRKIWNYKDYEIGIDTVKNLGNFVEIELKKKIESSEAERIKQEMVEFIKGQDCGEIHIVYTGYGYMGIYPDKIKMEKIA